MDYWSCSLCSHVAGVTHATISHTFQFNQPYLHSEYHLGVSEGPHEGLHGGEQGKQNVAAGGSVERCESLNVHDCRVGSTVNNPWDSVLAQKLPVHCLQKAYLQPAE